MSPTATTKRLLPKDHGGTYKRKCFLSAFDFGTDKNVECMIHKYKQPALAILDRVVVSDDQVRQVSIIKTFLC